jgi:glyoxylase-like metal-dependent hydrolase (beta-lactamase superfamily II)
MTRMLRRCCIALAVVWSACAAHALEVRFVPVADGVYAHIGDIGARSVDNEALNANIGLVVTPAGAVLIDSGATWRSARAIHEAVRQVTSQPLRWVINTGGQDHRWLGNGYFESQGVETIGHTEAADDMRARGGDQLAALRRTLGTLVEGTVPALPKRRIDGADARLELGGIAFELRHRGGGHTPGDLMVWLPQRDVLFAGDIVYIDRLLAVLPVSSTKRWLDAFATIEALAPRRLVPGHGSVTDLQTARSHTRSYLQALRAHMRHAVEAGIDLQAAVRTFDGNAWRHLANANDLAAGNANRVYLEVERE